MEDDEQYEEVDLDREYDMMYPDEDSRPDEDEDW